jgi:bifunctional enzyme Fae/Hps
MLDRKQKYLQIALNSTLDDAQRIISQIPLDKRIILEAGTPLIKAYGGSAINKIRFWWEQRVFGYSLGFTEIPQTKIDLLSLLQDSFKPKSTSSRKEPSLIFTPYIVADLKCMDRGAREVQIASDGGANAAVALGHAPNETLDAFIEECEKHGLDSMIDMMNVEFPLSILRELKKPPQAVILHRGVDEETFDSESEIPFHEIQRIKNEYDIMISVAGGDTFPEIQRAIFNDADIVVVWKSFYQSTTETAKLAEQFLKEIR